MGFRIKVNNILIIMSIIFLLSIFLFLCYLRAPLIVHSILYTCLLLHYLVSPFLLVPFIIINLIFLIPALRRILISSRIVSFIKKKGLIPKISQTEKIALNAGNTWIEKDLFSGKPDFKKIFKEKYNKLSKAEQSFLENQADIVCNMVTEQEISELNDLPPKIWEYLKKEKFFGMIIPKKYGGLGFSALGHSEIVQKLSTRSQAMAITVMVPNSLGPAELLLSYGTKKQKDYYLPRLAKGEDIPCFALTEPNAGSDATALDAEGEIFKDKNGKIKIKLNFYKRYITLGAVSTVIGLAFRLKDPKNILGKEADLGITCALIKAPAKGLEVRRTDPLGVPFINSVLIGKDVEISMEEIIGEDSGVGLGWKMLMECLSVGRGISLPAISTGGSKLVSRTVANYAHIRKQFGTAIANFEGIKEKMAEIYGFTYLLDASRIFTASAIDNGNKPAVANAIMKYQATEFARKVINNGMDILGGSAICRGKNNLLANHYTGIPIAITVEGANIMTRSLIQFGQGMVRCHPYVYEEMEALRSLDVKKFDEFFFKHIGHFISNKVRSFFLSLTRGHLHVSSQKGILKKYERKLNWASSRFSFYADVALLFYGQDIKRKEYLSGRFGDILSNMYLLSCLMKRYGVEKKNEEAFIWGAEYCLNQIDDAFAKLLSNMGAVTKVLAFLQKINPIGSFSKDRLTSKLANISVSNRELLEEITNNVFIAKDKQDILVKMEQCFKLMKDSSALEKRIKTAIKKGDLAKGKDLLKEALKKEIVTKEEGKTLEALYKLYGQVIEIDSVEFKQ